jgi:hypothetical protein
VGVAKSWKDVEAHIDSVANDLDADVYAYFGEISREGAARLSNHLTKNKARKNALLMLATYGGDANGAYLIARQIQAIYGTKKSQGYKGATDPTFSCFVPTFCKSSGTILAIGADKLIVCPDAEFGPIDIQVRKHDEVGERTSGLTTAEALTALQGRSKIAFVDFFKGLRFDPQLLFSTKMAAEVAGTLTVGLFKPVLEQLDPMRLAEMERTLRVSAEYGRRLDVGNLKDGGLTRLLTEYPSHGFIIDSMELREIFSRVEDASPDLRTIADDLNFFYRSYLEKDDPFVFSLSKKPSNASGSADDDQTNHRDGSADGSAAEEASGSDAASVATEGSTPPSKRSRRRKRGSTPAS